MSKECTNLIDNLNEVYETKEKHNLSWAFKNAQELVDEAKSNYACDLEEIPNGEIEVSQDNREQKWVRRNKVYTQIFAAIPSVLTYVEFALSVFLVILISNISHSVDVAIESRIFSFWVVFTFAAIKVFIDSIFIKPGVEKWGWELYKKSVDGLERITSFQSTEKRLIVQN